MGRPLPKKFFGDTADAGNQIQVLADLGSGAVLAWIIEQKGSNYYIATDGTDILKVELLDAAPAAPGEAQCIGTTSGGPVNVRQINMNDAKGFDSITYDWSFDAPVSAKDMQLPHA